MNKQEIEKEVRLVLSQMLGCKISDVDNLSNETEPKWDSLKHVEILFAIEAGLGIQFEEAEMTDLKSYSKLVDSAVAHLET